MRHRPRKDTNHRSIAAGLRAAGCSVCDMAAVGDGFPDLVVGRGGRTYLLEIKAEAGRPTEAQIDFIAHWRGGPLSVVRSLDEALRIVGAMPHKSMFVPKPL